MRRTVQGSSLSFVAGMHSQSGKNEETVDEEIELAGSELSEVARRKRGQK